MPMDYAISAFFVLPIGHMGPARRVRGQRAQCGGAGVSH